MAEKTATKKEAKKDTKASENNSEKLAVIRTGGKQYLVAEGDLVKIEKLAKEVKKGDKITFDDVLLIIDGEKISLGKPKVTGKKVAAEVAEVGRAKKISVIHYKSKSRYFKRNGHRQPFVKVRISKIA